MNQDSYPFVPIHDDLDAFSEDVPVAWQSDVFGQRDNDLFLADFLDGEKIELYNGGEYGWSTWRELVNSFYEVAGTPRDNWMIYPSDLMESAALEASFLVVWDEGVYIFRNEVETVSTKQP